MRAIIVLSMPSVNPWTAGTLPSTSCYPFSISATLWTRVNFVLVPATSYHYFTVASRFLSLYPGSLVDLLV